MNEWLSLMNEWMKWWMNGSMDGKLQTYTFCMIIKFSLNICSWYTGFLSYVYINIHVLSKYMFAECR